MYVYLIQSQANPAKRYVGLTKNLQNRLREHNAGKSYYTAKHKPWELISATWFKDESKARQFERYLKAGSGHVFAQKYLW